jgi:putative transposase
VARLQAARSGFTPQRETQAATALPDDHAAAATRRLTERHCSQHTSADLAAHLAKYKITGSMGATGVCWDNAMAESFFAALKNELVHRSVFPTRAHARRAVAEYIEIFYNRQRLHSGLGYQIPHEVLTAAQRQRSAA